MQRVGICRALMQRPKLLLADEPIASLDPAAARTVMDYMQKIAQEKALTCIVNLHQVDFAKRYATRIIGLKNGQMVFDGLPEDLTEEMADFIYDDDSGGDEGGSDGTPPSLSGAERPRVKHGAGFSNPVALSHGQESSQIKDWSAFVNRGRDGAISKIMQLRRGRVPYVTNYASTQELRCSEVGIRIMVCRMPVA